MNDRIKWRIPPSVLRGLMEMPKDRPIALLLRHSVRDELPPGNAGNSLPITADGIHLAQELGGLIGDRLRSLHTSPLTRCVQTAEALNDGAGTNLSIVHDRLLGDPGVFVIDGQQAQLNWEKLGHEGVMQHLVVYDEALPGMARPEPAARFLVHHMLSVAGDVPGLYLFVTHDSLVTASAARLLRQQLGINAWPWYLEGAFFWRKKEGLYTKYRDHHHLAVPGALCSLSKDDVVEFARREIARTVGLDSGARFFLAGGAFKTLLTGRSPRDLDLWAPSARDRELLISTLEKRGAIRLPDKPYSDAFQIHERVVEIPHEVGPTSLDGRLARFDIAIAAVGVEHCPDDSWTACIHPLATESVDRQEVLLLKPLVNWKYALTTLERMRRYATELGFVVPKKEEEEIRREFLMQPPEIRAGMIARFERTTLGVSGSNVVEEAVCWCQ